MSLYISPKDLADLLRAGSHVEVIDVRDDVGLPLTCSAVSSRQLYGCPACLATCQAHCQMTVKCRTMLACTSGVHATGLWLSGMKTPPTSCWTACRRRQTGSCCIARSAKSEGQKQHASTPPFVESLLVGGSRSKRHAKCGLTLPCQAAITAPCRAETQGSMYAGYRVTLTG